MISRLIWSLIAKYSNWLREHLYGVNLKKSEEVFQQIGNQLDKNDGELVKIYNCAVEKFNAIAPRHTVSKLQFGPQAANEYLAEMLKEGTPLDLTDLQKFQHATELDLGSAKFPVAKAALEQIFASCPDLNEVLVHLILTNTLRELEAESRDFEVDA